MEEFIQLFKLVRSYIDVDHITCYHIMYAGYVALQLIKFG